MKTLSLQYLRQFKFQSILARIVAAFLLVCIGVSVIYTVLFGRLLISSVADGNIITAQSELSGLIEDIDSLFVDTLHQSLVQLSNSSSLYTLAYQSEATTYNQYYAAVSLSNTALFNDLIDSVIVCIPKKDCIVTSGYKYFGVAESPYAEMISSYESDELSNAVTIQNVNRISSLFSFDGQYVLALDFPLSGSHKLGTVFAFVNMQKVYQSVAARPAPNNHIWVYHDSLPVFSAYAVYPAETSEELRSGEQRSNGIYRFSRHSDVLEWDYWYMLDESSLFPSVREYIPLIIPMAAVTLILFVAITFFVSLKIYQPVTDALAQIPENLLASSADRPIPRNELELLESTISSLNTDNSRLQFVVKDVSHDLLSKLFRDLFSGKQLSRETIEATFRNAESPFRFHAPYLVCIVENQTSLSAEDRHMHISNLLNDRLATFAANTGALFHIMHVDSNMYGIVLSFQQSDAGQHMQEINQLKTIIGEAAYRNNLLLAFSYGRVYYTVLDLVFSYEEARSYIIEKKPFSRANAEDAALTGEDDSQFEHRAKQIVELTLQNKRDAAASALSRICAQLERSYANTEALHSRYTRLISGMLDVIGEQKYLSFSVVAEDLPLFAGDNSERGELIKNMRRSCDAVMESLSDAVEKQLNPHINSARKYIGEHYQDSTLSLEETAEAIGLSASYLSKLFKNNLNVNFVTYLNDFRIEKSLDLLKKPDVFINDIGEMVGFASPQNYIRVFKKYNGTTPGQFRRQQLSDGMSSDERS